MSLQIWLPLNGTVENNGLGQITKTSGTAKFDKVGKTSAKAFNLNSRVSFTCPQLANLKTFSVCFWAMTEPSSTLTTNWQDVLGFNDIRTDGTWGTFRWETCYNSTTWAGDGIQWHNNRTNALVDGSYTHNISRNEWVHCCVVFNAEAAKVYSYTNGILKQTHKHQGGSFNTGGIFYIGETNNIEGRIQDVRFYDHALSPKEVKEISKGLCLHYRLSGHGCENLIVNSQQLQDKFYTYNSSWEKSYKNGIWTATCTKAGNGGPHTPVFPKTTDKIGKTYTFSCLIRSSRNIKLNIGHECGGAKDFNITTTWQRITNSWVFTDTTNNSVRWYALNGVTWNVDDWFQVKDFKIEEGDKATPWVPNPTDALYTAMGYNSTIEPDCSGFGNNGTKVGDIAYDSDTARYTTSYKFNNAPYITSNSGSMSWWGGSQGTISVWLNPTSTPSGWSGSFGIQHDGGYNYKTFSISNYGGKFTVHVANGSWTFYRSDTLPINKWSFLVATINGTELKMYMNGILKLTATISWNNATIAPDTRMVLANDMPDNDEKYEGKASDFRFYATTLSAEDVLGLYQTGASVDNSGNAWAYEYKEGE